MTERSAPTGGAIPPRLDPVVLARQVAAATASPRERSDGERARLLLGIRSHLQTRRTRRRQRLVALALLPLACGAFWASTRHGIIYFRSGSAQLPSHAEPEQAQTKVAPLAPAIPVAPTLPATFASEWQELRLADLGTLRLKASTDYALPAAATRAVDPLAGVELDLRSGTVCADIPRRNPATQGPFIVRAPGIAVWDLGTEFCVEAKDDLSTVSVTEGQVRVQRPAGRALVLRAGEFLRSDDLRLAARGPSRSARAAVPASSAVAPPAPLQPAPAAPPPSPALPPAERGCETAPTVEARRSCYEQRARGEGVAAENALYSLALLDAERHDGPAAIGALQRYQRRFADGFLKCEVAFSLLQQHALDKDWPAAASEAEAFADRCPRSERSAEIQVLRADALLELGRYAQARTAYQLALHSHLAPELAAAARKGLERANRLAPVFEE